MLVKRKAEFKILEVLLHSHGKMNKNSLVYYCSQEDQRKAAEIYLSRYQLARDRPTCVCFTAELDRHYAAIQITITPFPFLQLPDTLLERYTSAASRESSAQTGPTAFTIDEDIRQDRLAGCERTENRPGTDQITTYQASLCPSNSEAEEACLNPIIESAAVAKSISSGEAYRPNESQVSKVVSQLRKGLTVLSRDPPEVVVSHVRYHTFEYYAQRLWETARKLKNDAQHSNWWAKYLAGSVLYASLSLPPRLADSEVDDADDGMCRRAMIRWRWIAEFLNALINRLYRHWGESAFLILPAFAAKNSSLSEISSLGRDWIPPIADEVVKRVKDENPEKLVKRTVFHPASFICQFLGYNSEEICKALQLPSPGRLDQEKPGELRTHYSEDGAPVYALLSSGAEPPILDFVGSSGRVSLPLLSRKRKFQPSSPTQSLGKRICASPRHCIQLGEAEPSQSVDCFATNQRASTQCSENTATGFDGRLQPVLASSEESAAQVLQLLRGPSVETVSLSHVTSANIVQQASIPTRDPTVSEIVLLGGTCATSPSLIAVEENGMQRIRRQTASDGALNCIANMRPEGLPSTGSGNDCADPRNIFNQVVQAHNDLVPANSQDRYRARGQRQLGQNNVAIETGTLETPKITSVQEAVTQSTQYRPLDSAVGSVPQGFDTDPYMSIFEGFDTDPDMSIFEGFDTDPDMNIFEGFGIEFDADVFKGSDINHETHEVSNFT
ncbi:MAG: hypothetical protein Q9187_000982 [Circinaria calcarea]